MSTAQQKRIEQEEAKLAALLEEAAAQQEAANNEEPGEPVTPAEPAPQKPEENSNEKTPAKEDEPKGWEKRYADLRRHTQAKETEYKAKLADLETKVEEAAKGNLKHSLPASPAELDEWREKDPDGFAVLESVAKAMVADQMSDVRHVQDELRTTKEEIAKNKAELAIKKAHPDFEDLQNSEDFLNWADSQPQMVQNAVYESTKPEDVIWALDTYKLTLKGKAKPSKKDNAKVVPVKSTPVVDAEGEKDILRESEVATWSEVDFKKNMDKLDKARANGTFIYDLSGGAR